MYAMSLAKAVPDAELLDEFARRYPQHADALTEFAIELAIDALMQGETSRISLPMPMRSARCFARHEPVSKPAVRDVARAGGGGAACPRGHGVH